MRVVLANNNKPAAPADDYINASHIKNLLAGAPEFITAQGPMPNTVAHFWKMVAQARARVIVMLTRVKESGRVKCEEYWPAVGKTLAFPASGAGAEVPFPIWAF